MAQTDLTRLKVAALEDVVRKATQHSNTLAVEKKGVDVELAAARTALNYPAGTSLNTTKKKHTLQKDLEDRDATITAVRKAFDEQFTELATLKQTYADAVNAAGAHERAAQTHLDASTAAIAQLTAALTGARAEITQLTLAVAGTAQEGPLRTRITELEETVRKKEESNEQITNLYTALNQKHTNLTDEHTSIQTANTQYVHDISCLRTALTEDGDKLRDLTQQQTAMGQLVVGLQGTNDALKAEMLALTTYLDSVDELDPSAAILVRSAHISQLVFRENRDNILTEVTPPSIRPSIVIPGGPITDDDIGHIIARIDDVSIMWMSSSQIVRVLQDKMRRGNGVVRLQIVRSKRIAHAYCTAVSHNKFYEYLLTEYKGIYDGL